jgi:polyhydroxyalkanoate synthesis regulator phasin
MKFKNYIEIFKDSLNESTQKFRFAKKLLGRLKKETESIPALIKSNKDTVKNVLDEHNIPYQDEFQTIEESAEALKQAIKSLDDKLSKIRD